MKALQLQQGGSLDSRDIEEISKQTPVGDRGVLECHGHGRR